MQNYRLLLRELPKDVLKAYPLRLMYLGVQTLVSVLAVAAIVELRLAWPIDLALALVIGHCWGMNGLAGHEILHGSVVRNRGLQDVLGFVSFLPFLISPTFWRYWHNNQHHSHTQKLLKDPDAYPTHRIFKHSKFMQWMFPFTPGSKFKRSYLYLFFWFSFNVQIAQFYFRFRNDMFEKLDHRRVNYELALGIALTFAFLAYAGPSHWLFVAVVPFLVQNYLVFSYISTNHNLSPLTKENDPLANSLSVTNHPILEFLHLNFGYHVEHHLFPSMNPRHAKAVHQILKKHYPETYQVMPKWQALKELYRTARIYKNHNELIHPLSLEVFQTLGPQVEASADSRQLLKLESDNSMVIQSEDPQATPSLI
jgi:fatty acid desaturase